MMPNRRRKKIKEVKPLKKNIRHNEVIVPTAPLAVTVHPQNPFQHEEDALVEKVVEASKDDQVRHSFT